MKFCRDCDNRLPLVEYYSFINRHGTLVYMPYCKECTKRRNNNHYHANMQDIRDKEREKRYGINKQARLEMMRKQGMICPVCELDLDGRVSIDHNHTTGEVRGVLHMECNSALGLLRDNPIWLSNGARYLTR